MVIKSETDSKQYHGARKILLCALLMLIFCATLTACADETAETVLEGQSYDEDIITATPTFLNLEYMYSFEDSELTSDAIFFGGEFTWFRTYEYVVADWFRPYFFIEAETVFDNVNRSIEHDHGFKLPEYFEVDSDSFITISIGRKLSMLYYFPEELVGGWPGTNPALRFVVARPVFEREYHSNTVFVYRVSPLPQNDFACQIDNTDNLRQFNLHRHIPFEVWPSITEISHHRPQELEEPLRGHVAAHEALLMRWPTMKTETVTRLSQGGEITVYGYIDDGEDVDGNSRWYFIWTSLDARNRSGYIHSSFVNIISSVEN